MLQRQTSEVDIHQLYGLKSTDLFRPAKLNPFTLNPIRQMTSTALLMITGEWISMVIV